METGDLLRELVQFLEQAAPVVWVIARRQVWVVVVQQVVGILLCGLVTGFAYKQYQKVANSERSRDDKEFFQPVYILLGSIAAILGIALLLGALGRIVNPDYYAIALLLQYVK